MGTLPANSEAIGEISMYSYPELCVVKKKEDPGLGTWVGSTVPLCRAV